MGLVVSESHDIGDVSSGFSSCNMKEIHVHYEPYIGVSHQQMAVLELISFRAIDFFCSTIESIHH